MVMIEDRYLKMYYENYFLNDKCNWGYLYIMLCMADKEIPKLEAAEKACEVQERKENWLAACIKKARYFFSTNARHEPKV
jgi:hypothetical protein